MRRGKVTAIIFVILFLGYYQRWLYVPILEALSGKISVDPAAPSLLENIENVHRIRGQLAEEEGLKIQVQTEPPPKKVDPRFQKQADKLALSLQRDLEITQRGQNLKLMVRGCRGPKVICGAPIGNFIIDCFFSVLEECTHFFFFCRLRSRMSSSSRNDMLDDRLCDKSDADS